MALVAIPAHFDGKQIVLDEPFALPANASLLVTILPSIDQIDIEEDAWIRAVAASDSFKFLSDPGEDIYSLDDGEPLTRSK